SHSVKTKSILGASGFENSSQLLLRKPVVGIGAAFSSLKASGRTLPVGWPPALCAVNSGCPLKFIIASAMIEREELPVHKNRRFWHFLGSTVSCRDSVRSPILTARLRLRRTHERAHEFTRYLRSNRIDINTFCRQHLTRIFRLVDARWLDLDLLEPCI